MITLSLRLSTSLHREAKNGGARGISINQLVATALRKKSGTAAGEYLEKRAARAVAQVRPGLSKVKDGRRRTRSALC